MRYSLFRFHRLAIAILVTLGVMASAQPASAARLVAPIKSQPHGLSYGDWGARWYQWALGTPVSVNPVAGADCRGGQVAHVWFLHGVFGAGEAERSCRIPAGTALFFPLINNAYAAFLNDPPETRTEAFVRSMATCNADALSASIDGQPIEHPARYHVDAQETPLFEIQLPVDNILGLTEADAQDLLLSPVAHSGYYLFLHPLSPGTHTIEWQASGACGAQDITYTIEVVPRGKL